jgi:tetratricopeptide (TPR) repeat protein
MIDNSSNVKKTYRNTIQIALWVVKLLFLLALVAQGARLLARQLPQETGQRELVAVVNRLPMIEQLKTISCSRTPLAGELERAALQEAVLRLAQPAQRAAAYCLLGDYPSALAAYQTSASAGDDWSALQVYFLLARQGDMQAAKQALGSIHLSDNGLQKYYNSLISLKLNIDVMPVVQRIVELDPGDPANWKFWLDAARGYERASNWQSALDAYLEAIQVQEKLGVRIGRSSFELGAGRLYQTRLEPRDLNSALIYYNGAIADMDFLLGANPSNAFLYRGEVYQGLRPAYTSSQALQEFLRSLALDPKNYWAMQAIAGVYLYDLKDYPSAELYINRAIGLNPDLSYAYLTRGDLYRQEGNLQGAITAYQDALTRQPGYQAALDRLAAAQAQLKKQAP